MNQILSLGHDGVSKEQLNKSMGFFSIFIIIFALIFIIEGILGLKESGLIFSKDGKSVNRAHIATPEINIKRNGNITILKISSSIGVQKLIYAWNNGLENVIEKNGEKDFEENLETTIGINDLNLKVIDSDGNTITYDSVKIAYENVEEPINWEEAVANDTIKPIITLSPLKGKVKISVTDETKMSYIVYKWNDEEEIKVTGLSDDEKTIISEIDVLKGTNKLNVKAYDKAGNCAETTREVQGIGGEQNNDENQNQQQNNNSVVPPKIDVKKYDDQLVIKISGENKINKVEYNFNGITQTIDNVNNEQYEFKLDLIEGENYVIINAYDNNNLKSEYKGKTKK